MKKICISLVNYNGEEQTNACLDSLEHVEKIDVELLVVVIDNASEKPFSSQKEYHNFSLEIILNEKNLGFSGGHNIAIHYAKRQQAEFIIILNNDTIVDKKCISELHAVFSQNEKIAAVVPKIYFAPGHEFHKDKYAEDERGKVLWYAGANIDWENVYGKHRGVDEVDTGQYDNTEKTELLTGCCVMIRLDIFNKIQTFDERYFLYFEDADLSERIKKSGYTIYYHPKAVIWHINAGSTGGSGSDLQDYFLSRNRLLFGFSYAPIRTKLALMKESVRLLSSGRKWQKKGIQDYFSRKFGKGSYQV